MREAVKFLLVATACITSVFTGSGASSGQSPSSPTNSEKLVRLEDYREGVDCNRSLMYSGFSQDGSTVVTTSSDATVRVYESKTGKLLNNIIDGDRESSYAFAASVDPRGRWIATGGPWMRIRSSDSPGWGGGIVSVWDLHEQWGENRYVEIFRFANDQIIKSISISKDGRFISGLDQLNNFFMIDSLKSQRAVVHPTVALRADDILQDVNNSQPYHDASYSDDGHRAVAKATKGGESGILLYDARLNSVRFISGLELENTATAGTARSNVIAIVAALIAPNGESIAISFNRNDNKLFIIDFESAALRDTVHLGLQTDGVERLEFGPGGQEIAVATADRKIVIYTIKDAEVVAEFEIQEWMWPIRDIAFLEDRLHVLGGAGKRAEQLAPETFDEQEDPSRLYIKSIDFSR